MRGPAIGALSIWLLGCGAAAPPASVPAVTDATTCASPQRWLATSPRVPLAAIVGGQIANADACSRTWAEPGSSWRALDVWGAPLAEAHTIDAELYDVTGAWEQRIEPTQPGRLLLSGSARLPAPTEPWTPTVAQADALVALVTPIEAGVHAPARRGQPAPRVAERTHFFRTGIGTKDERAFAVVADATLVVAQWVPASDELQRPAGWAIVYLDTQVSTSAPLLFEAEPGYQTVAVVDLDGDGTPEIVVHRNYIDAYDDVVLRMFGGSPTAFWSIDLASVHGGYA